MGRMDVMVAPFLPMQGALHFFDRPRLWYMLALPIVVSSALTIPLLFLFFDRLLEAQTRHFEGRFHLPEWVAWPVGFVVTLAEVAALNMIVFMILFGQVQSKIFRDVLEERGIMTCLEAEWEAEDAPRRVTEVCCSGDVRENSPCRNLMHSLLFLLARLALLILTMPLHGLPIFGQIFWLACNGWLHTWQLTSDFMVMARDRRSCSRQWDFVKENFSSYAAFGSVSMACELVPFIGPIIFYASNACGAAFLCERFFSETHHKKSGMNWVKKSGLSEGLLRR